MGVGSPASLHDVPFRKIAREMHAANVVGEPVEYEEVKDTPGVYKFTPGLGSNGIVITKDLNRYYFRRKEFSPFIGDEHAGETLQLWRTDCVAPGSWFDGAMILNALKGAWS